MEIQRFDLLTRKLSFKQEKDIQGQIRWWHYNQIEDLFNLDKRKMLSKSIPRWKKFF